LAEVNLAGILWLAKMIPGFSLCAGQVWHRAVATYFAQRRGLPVVRVAAFLDGHWRSGIGPRDFGNLKGFCHGLSPEMKRTSCWLKEVSRYYRIIALVEKLPTLSTWANREMQLCSRYAAVVLDQNLAMNMDHQLASRMV